MTARRPRALAAALACSTALAAGVAAAPAGAGLSQPGQAAAPGTHAASAPAAHSARSGSRRAKERAIRTCANRHRADAGLPALRYDADLVRAARLHASNMRSQRFFGHVDRDGRDPADRVALFTDRFGGGVGENIAAGYRTARATCAAWMRSEGHRANILDPDYAHIGTGFARGGRFGTYYVQVFALPPAEPPPAEPPPE